MYSLTKALLCGAALCALTVVPAVAESGSLFDITALHAGRTVKKTKMQHGATHITSTLSVFTYVPGTVGAKSTVLDQQFCNMTPPIKVKARKKSAYGRIPVNTQTYSNGCEHVEATYKVVKQPDPNTTDNFVISIIGKFEGNGTKYRDTLNLAYTVIFQ
jgi:hypothetical protein